MTTWLDGSPLAPVLASLAYAIAALAVLPCAYLFGLSVAALFGRMARKPVPASPGPEGQGHLAFVVPSHNEEADIEATLRGLTAIADAQCSIHVVADNCSDRTAELARAFAAQSGHAIVVWERSHETLRAKGYALEWALPQIFEQSDRPAASGSPALSALGPVRFVCIVDADALLTPNSVPLARARFAEGFTVVQSEYVFGKGLGLRAEVMRMASAAMVVRGLGRSALGLSDTLKGNGMFFRRAVLEETPWCAYSLAEDLEYTMLLLKKGHRVHILGGSQVSGKLSATTKGETDQRLRWEGGRLAVVRKETANLVRELFSRPSLQTLDMLLELVIPPLGLLVGLQAAALVVTALLPGYAWMVILFGWGLLGTYIALSVLMVGLPLRTFLALAYVPFYVLWKLILLPKTWAASRSKRWVRTAR